MELTRTSVPIKGLPEWFVALWCVLMPLTSFLIMPSVQGTIPAYLLAFASVFFVILSRNGGQPNIRRIRYFKVALLVAGAWVLLLCGSQLGHIFSDRYDFGDMFLNNPGDTRVVLRSVLITQSLYLAACLCIALFFRFFFRPEWMRYVLWGAWFLAIYGIYEWLFFLIFGQSGDFFANRTYGENFQTGSWSQAIQIGPLSLIRIKSTFGEPSFFSAAVIPYLILALEYRRKWLCAALMFCIVFSTSTSAFIGLAFALLVYSIFQRKFSLSTVFVILLFVGAFATLYFAFPDTYDEMFTSKLNGANDSGEIHQSAIEAMNDAINTFSVANRLFGIGFGYFYGSVFNAILVNTGWTGMAIYVYAFLKPAILLRAGNGGLGLKVAVATLFFLYFINVSELFLPTTWMFLGLAYWRLDQQREEHSALQFGAEQTPSPAG
jgi:hypothetical protein